MHLLSADSGTELRVVLLNPHHSSVTWACRGTILQMRKMKAWRGNLPGSDNESEVEPESQPRPSCLRGQRSAWRLHNRCRRRTRARLGRAASGVPSTPHPVLTQPVGVPQHPSILPDPPTGIPPAPSSCPSGTKRSSRETSNTLSFLPSRCHASGGRGTHPQSSTPGPETHAACSPFLPGVPLEPLLPAAAVCRGGGAGCAICLNPFPFCKVCLS